MDGQDKSTGADAADSVFLYDPVVFAVGGDYQLIFLTRERGMAYAEVGGDKYTDNFCGTVRSSRDVHRIIIPAGVLNAAGEYTVCFSTIPDRVPYFPKSGDKHRRTYKFYPPRKGTLRLYMLADTHSTTDAPARAAGYFGSISSESDTAAAAGNRSDALLLCGDIGNSAKNLDNLLTVHKISAAVTGGERPVVFARGNHDTRGEAAELFDLYMGTDRGDTYFTFRLGEVWGVVLDCGEDKDDSHEEYGDIADYRQFRKAQANFLNRIIKERENEYAAPGVKYRIALCHIPFTVIKAPFADDIYNEWTAALNEIGINLLLSGHAHRISHHPAGEIIETKLPAMFPAVVGSRMSDAPYDRSIKDSKEEFTGTALEFTDGGIKINFTNSRGEVVGSADIAAATRQPPPGDRRK